MEKQGARREAGLKGIGFRGGEARMVCEGRRGRESDGFEDECSFIFYKVTNSKEENSLGRAGVLSRDLILGKFIGTGDFLRNK